MPVIEKTKITQEYILEVLQKSDGMTVVDLAKSTGYSQTLIRQKLDTLTARAEVLIDKKRQPFYYSINPDSPAAARYEIVERAKRELYNKDSDNSLVKVVRELPKDQWYKYIEPLRVLADAIEQLDAEGKLIETLEDMR